MGIILNQRKCMIINFTIVSYPSLRNKYCKSID
nr:MAG TPA: hypothetical protein [Bacteriophage sp.]